MLKSIVPPPVIVTSPLGLHRGRILSPAIYNIYTSDFPTNPSVSVCLFADDAAILCNSITADQAVRTTQAYLSQLETWLTKWRIAINTEKNNAIVFRKVKPRSCLQSSNFSTIKLTGHSKPLISA
ncbi:RNA-directed DNA polymerase from mobile element jockey [Trichonephila clavipes]|nr:RNA-directed DNA polymerase from mobile element jockey [Trichonephila clavipes]